jgi:cell division septum initiation protein DivIVA
MNLETEVLTNEQLQAENRQLQRDISNLEIQIKEYQQIVKELSAKLETRNTSDQK